MLVLYLATLFKRLTRDELDRHKKLSCVLVNYEPQFPELIEFIQSSSTEYNLDLVEYNTTMRDGFATYLTHHPSVEAIIVGTRRTDPHSSSLQQFQPTDHGWPKFIRVHPVLDWRYDEIWCFLKMTGTKYCPLYDEGYTSLGGVATTVKNPALKQGSGFRPAYELSRGDEREREGRMSSR
jgi:FAD synthetase